MNLIEWYCDDYWDRIKRVMHSARDSALVLGSSKTSGFAKLAQFNREKRLAPSL